MLSHRPQLQLYLGPARQEVGCPDLVSVRLCKLKQNPTEEIAVHLRVNGAPYESKTITSTLICCALKSCLYAKMEEIHDDG